MSKGHNHTLDRTDLRILEHIQNDSSLTNLELAEAIGLSASPCFRRVKILEEAGLIGSRRAQLDEKRLGLDLSVIIQVSMDQHTHERFENFEATVRELREVQQCYLITGQDADYLLKVVLPNMEAYQEFLLNKITRIEGVSGVHSSFIMRKVVDTTALPLQYVNTR